MSCDVKNVIYVIKCRGCGEEYIGETSDLRKRVAVNNQQIRDISTRMLPVSTHLDNCTGSKFPKYKIVPFFKMLTENSLVRKKGESYFIKAMKPKLNQERQSRYTTSR